MLLTHWRAPRLLQELQADVVGATCRVLEQAGLLELNLDGARRGGGLAKAAAVAEGRQGLVPVTGRLRCLVVVHGDSGSLAACMAEVYTAY